MTARWLDRFPPRPVVSASLAVAGTLPGDALLYAVLPIVWEELGLELWMVGVLLSANRFVRLLSNPLAGRVVERFGAHTPFSVAMVAAAFTTGAYALGAGFAILLLARMAWGVCWSFLRLGAYMAALEASDARSRGYYLGFSSALVSVGTVVAVLFGGFLTDSIGFQATVLLFAVLAFVSWLGFRGERPWADSASEGSSRTAEASDPVAEAIAADSRRTWAVYGLTFVNAAAGAGIVVATLGLRLKQLYGDEVSVFGIALGVASLNGVMLAMRFGASLLLSPIAGRLSDRFGRASSLLLAGGLVVACLLALAAQPRVEWTLLAAVGVFLAGTVLRVSLDAAAGDGAPAATRARVMAAYSNAVDLGSAVGPFAAYPLAEAFGLGLVYQGAAACLIVVGCLAIWPLRRRPGGAAA